ncbi:MAG: 2-oxoglutarate synthase [Gammaproteobacteria bacterium]|jgi:2-oxoglutarate ferredoxin oxidoreductase subunit beta|nr:2-oxoglutarate synthase [Gammaproteobacteria bacterium]
MTEMIKLKAKDYKSTVKPIWCPGCGDFSVLNAITKAMAALAINKDDTVLVSGIGCSSRLPAYVDSYGFHGVHGRGLAIAQGLKVARPDLTVIAMGGDGDGFSIGGNHFIHACRRNVNMTYIVMDNEIYGMTKGQASPTTPMDWTSSKLTPHGTGVRPFKPTALALASGATWIGRGYSGNPNQMAGLIASAVEHQGFSFVHVMSQCITFCPGQTDWKAIVHERQEPVLTNEDEAAELFLHEDGFQTGILYQQGRDTWPPQHSSTTPTTPAQLAESFRIGS